MRMKFILTLCLCAAIGSLSAQYDDYFTSNSLRIDYIHAGTDTSEWIALDALIKEPYWGGSKVNLLES
ncbi:MAG: peptidase M64 N-terminal domain-containing protein, partial [Ignavibacteria bacterium]|nr:peptidase M64 N-terminal domain-containing protein [Ignavibacteria bacterium]